MLGTNAALADSWNDFDVSNALVSPTAIERGGPPRDGIPTIDFPKFTRAENTHWLRPEDRVLGLVRNGVARAYPVAILNWHEIVNDRIFGEPITITYCPLCGTGIAFESTVNGRKLRFAVSGLLYNSDVLLYDRETESLWSQIMATAVTGQLKGSKLTSVVLQHTSWGDWKGRHPDTTVLSRETGIARDYMRNPYQGYADNRRIWFSVASKDKQLHPKAWVVGVQRSANFKAYPFDELAQTNGVVKDQLGGEAITIHYDKANRSARITDQNNEEIPTISAYWFAWYAFHPDTEVFRASK